MVAVWAPIKYYKQLKYITMDAFFNALKAKFQRGGETKPQGPGKDRAEKALEKLSKPQFPVKRKTETPATKEDKTRIRGKAKKIGKGKPKESKMYGGSMKKKRMYGGSKKKMY